MSLSARVHTALLEAGRRTEREFTTQARAAASQAGWPQEAARSVAAHVDGGHFHMHFDGAEDWEYGTEDRPPSPVARSIESRTDTHVDRTYQGHLEDLLRGML